MAQGIYKITNLVNGKFYIGSSNNIEYRWQQHKIMAKDNKHHSVHFQNAWNEYGENSFIFEIIETVLDIKDLENKEQCWLDETKCYDPKVGYNISKDVFAPMRGREHTVETKRHLSELNTNELNPFYGKSHSQETKQKMSKSQSGELASQSRFTNEQIKQIRDEHLNGKLSIRQMKAEYEYPAIEYAIRNETYYDPNYIPNIVNEKYLSKLSFELANKIREEYSKTKVTYKELAEKYNVCYDSIRSIVRNETYADPEYSVKTKGTGNRINLETAKEIRKIYDGSQSFTFLGKQFGVTRKAIQKIIDNVSYSDPNYIPPSRS